MISNFTWPATLLSIEEDESSYPWSLFVILEMALAAASFLFSSSSALEANKEGLEDRIYRIKTERSGASSMPEPRTTHFTSNLEILSQNESEVTLRFNWLTKSYRYKKTAEFFGTSFYTLDVTGDQPLIREKRMVLNNDCINQVLDVYHL